MDKVTCGMTTDGTAPGSGPPHQTALGGTNATAQESLLQQQQEQGLVQVEEDSAARQAEVVSEQPHPSPQQESQQMPVADTVDCALGAGGGAPTSSSTPGTAVEALSSEVIRKLRLAGEAETNEDREIVCEEVFCDVTGAPDALALEQLGVATSAAPPFYVVLASYYASPRGAVSAEAVLFLLQKLYGQGYAAPLVSLLLHRWLLLCTPPSRGPPEELRARLAHVTALGAAQLFLGDVHGGAKAFEHLWRCLCYEVILGQVDAPGTGVSSPGGRQHPGSGLALLPSASRTPLLAAVAAPLVYYAPTPLELQDLLMRFPPPSAPVAAVPRAAPSTLPLSLASRHNLEERQQQLQSRVVAQKGSTLAGTSPAASSTTPPPLLSGAWAGADFIMLEVIDMLGKLRSETGLLHFLRSLRALGTKPLSLSLVPMRLITRLRLQSELHSLTSSGAPHYAPRAVRAAAREALDALFPRGRWMRNLVQAMFRLLHPSDLLGDVWLVPMRWCAWAYSKVVLSLFWALYSLLVFSHQRQPGCEAHTLSLPRSNGPRSGAQQAAFAMGVDIQGRPSGGLLTPDSTLPPAAAGTRPDGDTDVLPGVPDVTGGRFVRHRKPSADPKTHRL